MKPNWKYEYNLGESTIFSLVFHLQKSSSVPSSPVTSSGVQASPVPFHVGLLVPRHQLRERSGRQKGTRDCSSLVEDALVDYEEEGLR